MNDSNGYGPGENGESGESASAGPANPPDAEANPPDAEANPPDAEANPPGAEANPLDAEANPLDTGANPPNTDANLPDTESNPPDTEANLPDIELGDSPMSEGSGESPPSTPRGLRQGSPEQGGAHIVEADGYEPPEPLAIARPSTDTEHVGSIRCKGRCGFANGLLSIADGAGGRYRPEVQVLAIS